MAKKILKVWLKIAILIMVYILQIFVINNISFCGINGDLCLMAIAIIALQDKNIVAYITAGVCGIVSDILFSTTVCKYLTIYILVVSFLIGLKKVYKQDSKMAIIIFSVASVCISEILMYIFNVITKIEFVNLFWVIYAVIKECVINICLAFLLHIALKCCKQEEK